jgi:hypothetical protein
VRWEPTSQPTTTKLPAWAAGADRARVEELRSRYQPLALDEDLRDYAKAYGAEERSRAGQPKELAALAEIVAEAAGEMTGRPSLQRYMLVRAFVLARSSGATVTALLNGASKLLALLDTQVPSCLAQRAEVLGAVAEASLNAAATGGPAARTLCIQTASGANRAYRDLALWQIERNYLEAASETLAYADKFAKAGGDQEGLRHIVELRARTQQRSELRSRYFALVQRVKAKSEDPQSNRELARFLLIYMNDIGAALEPARKSGDPQLRALADAAGPMHPANVGPVGIALAALAESAPNDEKPVLARMASDYLAECISNRTGDDASFLQAKLAFAKMQQLTAANPSPPPGDQPGAIFAPTRLQRVVYVCDASGSMVNKFDDLRHEIRKAVRSLAADQSFNVIMFQEDSGKAFNTRNLVPASKENFNLLAKFLDATAGHGQTKPIPAIRLAFSMNPQVIHLLTDGDFADNNEVIKELALRNRDRKVIINTIAFIDRGETYEKVLKEIAEQHGGTFRFVSETDLRPGR